MTIYNVICGRCKQAFESTDQNDLDGYGNCPPCYAIVTDIAKRIDAQAALRAKQPQPVKVLPKQFYFEAGN